MRFLTSSSVRRRVTVVVWLLGMMVATTLIARRPSSQIRGLGWGEPVVLAAPSDGVLTGFEAILHQPVAAGDLIARFDPEILSARHHVLLAEIEALTKAQIADRQGRDRLFERDREEAGLELGGLTARVRENQARVEALYERLAIDERLFAEGIAPEEHALAVRREIKVAETRLAADREHLDMVRSSVNKTSSRAATAPGPNQWQIEAARRELDEIEQQIDRLSLRSSISGQITEIYRHPGEWLRAGEQVLRISPLTATEVHAWLDSRTVPRLAPGASAHIRRSSGQRLIGSVSSIGVERLQMPRSLWERSDFPEWGYLMRIEIAEGTLAPGEPVQVGLLPEQS